MTGGSFRDYHVALRTMLDDGLQLESPATLVYWPNSDEPYLPGAATPSAHPTQSPSTAPWVRVTVLSGDNPRLTSHHREHFGRVIVQIFQPRSTGAGANESVLTALQAIFDRQQTSIATTPNVLAITETRVKEVGPEQEGWYQTNFEAAWSWLERDAA